ncbi:UNVERIFIED_CONTAM: PR5-like receptor kinase [Sesamum latifolium]|uniref:PR5-like receptor kinase n=1 Tax=Sesamum latifolium TaxID=2727402 RepID=A0AAW2X8S2_9LAMI
MSPNATGPFVGSRKVLSDQEKYVIIGVSLGIAGIVISSIIIFYIRKQFKLQEADQESKQNIDKFLLSHGSLAPKRYNYREIKKITNSFAEKLGKGGYGIVYKGKLPDGQLVAVKVLTETDNNAEEFINEVASISRTSHVNIVNLLGFCYDRKKRVLVYEYMPNKSLDKFICKSGGCQLDWETLYGIAVAVARGLEYLHRGCNTRIVHFDIKPQNILLDEEFCPKISDFGLAKLFKKKQSIISMLGTRGTVGYIAPEVFSRNFGAVSHKSNVYSFGMMLLEMAGARKNDKIEGIESSEDYFLDKIYGHVVLKNEKLDGLMTEEQEESARKMLLVGVWCIQTAPSDRPPMTKVVEMLEGSLESIQIPPKPFLYSPNLSGSLSSSVSVDVDTEIPMERTNLDTSSIYSLTSIQRIVYFISIPLVHEYQMNIYDKLELDIRAAAWIQAAAHYWSINGLVLEDGQGTSGCRRTKFLFSRNLNRLLTSLSPGVVPDDYLYHIFNFCPDEVGWPLALKRKFYL